jgi:hypothetical protein
MTIDEAIERLRKLPLPLKTKNDMGNHNAVMLGIEALKRCKEYRLPGLVRYSRLLPGETD